MLKNKFNRYTTAFLIIALASIALYPVALAKMVLFTWVLLGLVALAAILTISTK
jgi:hypothetical protein